MVRQGTVNQLFFEDNMEAIPETSNVTSEYLRRQLKTPEISGDDDDIDRLIAYSGKEIDISDNNSSRLKRKKKGFAAPGGMKPRSSAKRVVIKDIDFNSDANLAAPKMLNNQVSEDVEEEIFRTKLSVEISGSDERYEKEKEGKHPNGKKNENLGVFNDSFGGDLKGRSYRDNSISGESNEADGKQRVLNMADLMRAQGNEDFQSDSEFCFETENSDSESEYFATNK